MERTKEDEPRTSSCRIVMIGPNSSDSNCPKVAGVPSATNLCKSAKLNASSQRRFAEILSTRLERCGGRGVAHRTKAETDSKVYWLNLGLLGFLLI